MAAAVHPAAAVRLAREADDLAADRLARLRSERAIDGLSGARALGSCAAIMAAMMRGTRP
jgi:hypothetical protein